MKTNAKIDITKVKVGMIWYEDDTFSFVRLPNKKIKAIVELVDYFYATVYGDLTVSEILKIDEQCLCWDEAKKYLENFSYPCKMNEKIVWYDLDQYKKVYQQYYFVKKAFKILGKEYRCQFYWADAESYDDAWCFNFFYGLRYRYRKHIKIPVRPVLELTVE